MTLTPELLEHLDEIVELLLRGLDHEFRETKARRERLRARGHAGNVAGDDRMVGGNRRALEAADDDLLQRVPLIVRIDRTLGRNGSCGSAV